MSRPTVYDITERKRAESERIVLEKQLRESQKMEAIGTLAGGIAHDFNNMLAVILGNVQLAKEDAVGNDRALESLEQIRKAGNRGRDLVRQILSFSRRQPGERKVIELSRVVMEVVKLLRAMLPARLSLAVYCEPGVPAVLADATQIEQVIINLATNAMQATSGPGCITVRLDRVLLDSDRVAIHPSLRKLYDRSPA